MFILRDGLTNLISSSGINLIPLSSMRLLSHEFSSLIRALILSRALIPPGEHVISLSLLFQYYQSPASQCENFIQWSKQLKFHQNFHISEISNRNYQVTRKDKTRKIILVDPQCFSMIFDWRFISIQNTTQFVRQWPNHITTYEWTDENTRNKYIKAYIGVIGFKFLPMSDSDEKSLSFQSQ